MCIRIGADVHGEANGLSRRILVVWEIADWGAFQIRQKLVKGCQLIPLLRGQGSVEEPRRVIRTKLTAEVS